MRLAHCSDIDVRRAMGDLRHLQHLPPPPVPLTSLPPPLYTVHNLPPPVPVSKPLSPQPPKVGSDQKHQVAAEKGWALHEYKNNQTFSLQWQNVLKQLAIQTLRRKQENEVINATSERVNHIEVRVEAVEDCLANKWLGVLESNHEAAFEVIEHRFQRIENHFNSHLDPGYHLLGREQVKLLQELNQVKAQQAEERTMHAAQLAHLNGQLLALQGVVEELASKHVK